MKNKTRITALALIGIMVLTGCGADKKDTEQTKNTTYDCSKEYAADVEHLEDIIVEDDVYKELSDALKEYEEADVSRLTRKEAKKLKKVTKEIEAYYDACEQVLQEALEQIGQVYPTEDGFYDDAFKETAAALLQELDGLRNKGHYKDAAAKLKEITAAYTSYVKGKGQTVSAEIGMDTVRTGETKKQSAGAKADGKTTAAASSASGSTTSPSDSKGDSANNSGGNNTGNSTPSGSTSAPSGGNSPFGSSGNNNVPKPSKKTWTYTCDECGWTITAYENDYDANQQVYKHDIMHHDEEADAFAYVTSANNAMITWERENGTPITDQDTWLREHGYDPALLDSYYAKYGW